MSKPDIKNIVINYDNGYVKCWNQLIPGKERGEE